MNGHLLDGKCLSENHQQVCQIRWTVYLNLHEILNQIDQLNHPNLDDPDQNGLKVGQYLIYLMNLNYCGH